MYPEPPRIYNNAQTANMSEGASANANNTLTEGAERVAELARTVAVQIANLGARLRAPVPGNAKEAEGPPRGNPNLVHALNDTDETLRQCQRMLDDLLKIV